MDNPIEVDEQEQEISDVLDDNRGTAGQDVEGSLGSGLESDGSRSP